MAISSTVGKILYAIFFCIVIPFLLVLWADHVKVSIQIGDCRLIGMSLSFGGFFFIIWGMMNLWCHGKGLPMNGYPPTKFVQQGAYQIFNNPIYVGFAVLCAGISCWFGSAAGLFLITPVVILSCWALVVGYELPDLKKRFGDQYKNQGWFALVEDVDQRPVAVEKWKAAIAIILPWFILYELFVYLDVSTYFIDTTFTCEKKWPVISWMEIPYLSIYFFVAVAPFIQKTKSNLRKLMLDAWVSTAVGAFILLAFPFYASQRPVESNGVLSELIRFERTADSMAAAFPSFHVIWACVAATALTRASRNLKLLWWIIAALISISCVATGNHSIADVVAGFTVFQIANYHLNIWKWIQKKCELLANSWKSFQIGPLRVINHSLYAGLACATGIFLVAQFVEDPRAILLVTTSTLVGGAVWGQLTEGSSIMLRPFGYYGAIIGGVIGTVICYFFLGTSLTVLITAFALASPVI